MKWHSVAIIGAIELLPTHIAMACRYRGASRYGNKYKKTDCKIWLTDHYRM